jgi:8-oxo-dGTP pyrophosphatase MutT (NUDIX family)
VSDGFQSIGREVAWEGRIIRAGVEHFRHADGTESARDTVWHPGAVGIIPLDGDAVWLTRQPREVVGAQASLEIPAGKLDVAGEGPLASAQRELAEEIGKRAESWREVFDFYASGGFCDERIWLFLATGLSDAGERGTPEHEEDERITVIRWPLAELDAAIAETHDAKTLIALLWLARQLDRGLQL